MSLPKKFPLPSPDISGTNSFVKDNLMKRVGSFTSSHYQNPQQQRYPYHPNNQYQQTQNLKYLLPQQQKDEDQQSDLQQQHNHSCQQSQNLKLVRNNQKSFSTMPLASNQSGCHNTHKSECIGEIQYNKISDCNFQNQKMPIQTKLQSAILSLSPFRQNNISDHSYESKQIDTHPSNEKFTSFNSYSLQNSHHKNQFEQFGTLPAPVKSKKITSANKSLSNSVQKKYKFKTEPEEGINQQDQIGFFSVYGSKVQVENNLTKSNKASQRFRYEQPQKEENSDEIITEQPPSKIILSAETCSASQVFLSTEACSQQRISLEQSQGSGLNYNFLNEEETLVRMPQQNCFYHPSKKGKYIAKWEQNSSPSFVCSKCAIELASQRVKIEENQLETTESEMRRKMKELLQFVQDNQEGQEKCIRLLQNKREELNLNYIECSRKIEDAFLKAERYLMKEKNKAFEQVNAAKLIASQLLEEREKQGRILLREGEQMVCDILLHHDEILNGIELESFRSIVSNYNKKKDLSRQFFQSLKQETIEIFKFNEPQQEKMKEILSKLFEVQRVREGIVSSEKKQLYFINYPRSNTSENEQKGNNNQTNIMKCSNSFQVQPNKQTHQQISSPNLIINVKSPSLQFTNSQSKKDAQSHSNSNCFRPKMDQMIFNPLAHETAFIDKIYSSSTKHNRCSSFTNNELKGQASQITNNYPQSFKQQLGENFNNQNFEIMKNQQDKKFNSLVTNLSQSNKNEGNSFRCLFHANTQGFSQDKESKYEIIQQLRDNVTQQEENIPIVKSIELCNNIQNEMQSLNQQSISPMHFSQIRHQLDQVQEEGHITQSQQKMQNSNSEKYKNILEKINANQFKTSTFYSKLLQEPLKVDQDLIGSSSVVESLTLSQINERQYEQVMKQEFLKSPRKQIGQFASFIASHFKEKDETSNQKSGLKGLDKIEEQRKKEPQLSNSSSKGSYRKTLFQSPEFKQESQTDSLKVSPRAALAQEQGRVQYQKPRIVNEFQVSFNPNFRDNSISNE